MKKILLFLLILSGLAAKAQPYNNEWIDYNKTYYKFRVGKDGLYRINQSALAAIGLGSTPAQNFQLWKNGKEVSIYTSVSTGPLGSSDYIEFWGEQLDGKTDNELYRDPNSQINDKWSLSTDTAYYFLTVNTGVNKRIVGVTNNVAGNSLPPEPYFMHVLGRYYKDKYNLGVGNYVGDAIVYSSAYDKGEALTSVDIGPNGVLGATYSNLHVYASGPSALFKINAAGNNANPRSFKVEINGTQIIQQVMDYYDYVKLQQPVPVSLISSNTAVVNVTNLCGTPNDRMVVGQYELIYPRTFDFDNLKNFTFSLPANAAGNYLEITNFNYGSVAPVLYDLTNNKRYVADITNPAILKFALQPSAEDRKLVLVSEDASNINTITNFQTRNFINYGLSQNQGDYLIISNPILYTGSTGNNPVDDYRAYRNSPAGGNYNAKVYDINQLTDQFAFGIKKHASAIRNFIKYAYDNYSTQPRFVFLLGKGVNYIHQRIYEANSNPTIQSDLEKLNLVPTFGYPASDILLACYNNDNIPVVPVGRLSAINGQEVEIYLQKIKDYELAQAFQSCLMADKAWMKNVVHVVGADNGALQTILNAMTNNYSTIISDTLFGANVTKFSKTSSDPVQELNSEKLRKLFEEGISLLLYFGHSSATTLEFNLDDPMNYNNPGKYPVFITLGCNAGNLYNFNQNRFYTKETISEKFVFAQNRGSIAFLASTSLGIVQYLDLLNTNNYIAISRTKYGKSIGETMDEAIRLTFNITTQNDFYARIHCEQISLNGDPALKYNTHLKPDYVIEPQLVTVSPGFISVAENSFKVKAKLINMGKAIDRNIVVETKRTFPDNSVQIIQRDTIPGIRYVDSIIVNVPIVASRDKGLNKINITVDADNVVDELCETNNSLTRDVFIYEDEARPVYPYNLAIINKQNIKLVASTANPLASSKQYRMELDTTEFFNSPFKRTQTITSTGGVLEFSPGITFTDSTVYYWRVAPIPVSGTINWNSASFVYLANSDVGFNQSHFYQHTKSGVSRILIDSTTRKWTFDSLRHNLFAKNGVFLTASTQEGDYIVSVDGNAYIRSACVGFSLIFNIFDPYKLRPVPNPSGAYGSGPFCSPSRLWNFEYSYVTPASRKLAMDFMDSIPNGYYVVVRNILNNFQTVAFINEWKADTALYGSGNSLYHKLKNVGCNVIDSFTTPRAFIQIYQKNNNNFVPVGVVSQGMYDVVSLSKDLKTPDTLGYITSPLYGPAKSWKEVKWRGTALESSDLPTVDVIGVMQNGTEVPLFTGLTTGQQDFNISSVNANIYPYVKLKMKNQDSLNFTPYQLRYWRVTYVPVPEGAVAPNIGFQMKDSVDIGEPIDFKMAFKNISEAAFDSLKVKMVITDRNNVPNIIPIPRRRPLPSNDTIVVRTTINTRSLGGLNNLYVNVNPDFDQPEQYLFNNFVYKNFYVKPDSLNPYMDVTFDGVHILNRDIVSSKPNISIKLKDEAKWMTLSDTTLMTVKVKFPDGTIRRYYFRDSLQFTPAGPAPNSDNSAYVNLLPYFPQDGLYELIVTGKDLSNNAAGNMEYRVAFQVINKPMISNIFNYPNPFTTSTAFVFTITGSEVPQNIKIEIMTITGKVVREITKDELGPLHIGRNITEFKWDGTDQYGQKLANGIYLYRVITNLNGKSLDKYKPEGDNTDKYFNKGYGKMYLMR